MMKMWDGSMRAGRISGEDKRQGSARCSRCRCSRCRSAGAIAVRVQESLIFAAANWVELVWWRARNGGEFFTMWRILDGRGAVALPIARGVGVPRCETDTVGSHAERGVGVLRVVHQVDPDPIARSRVVGRAHACDVWCSCGARTLSVPWMTTPARVPVL